MKPASTQMIEDARVHAENGRYQDAATLVVTAMQFASNPLINGHINNTMQKARYVLDSDSSIKALASPIVDLFRDHPKIANETVDGKSMLAWAEKPTAVGGGISEVSHAVQDARTQLTIDARFTEMIAAEREISPGFGQSPQPAASENFADRVTASLPLAGARQR